MSIKITRYARKNLPKLLTFVLLAALATLIAPQPARAEPFFTVNNNADVPYMGDPTRLTNGVCETAPGNAVCTLRAAIMKANHYPGGGVTIQLDSLPYQLNIAQAGADDETTGDLNIITSMSVVGRSSSGTIVSGGGVSNDRVFHVMAGTLTLRRVTIRNGNPCNGNICPGGGLLVDSGAALILNYSRVYSNTSNAYGGAGGGIQNNGSLTLNYSAVTGNTGIFGAGIYNTGDATLINSTIDGNFGIGVYNDGFCFGCGTARIVNGTISNNTGGGVFNSGGPLIMINSTVFGNHSDGNGGGILNGEVNASPATTSLYNVTIAYNSAGLDQAGGGVYNVTGTVNIQNTIIAKNVHATSSIPFNARDDCGGTLTSYDYNLISDMTGCTVVGSISSNKINLDPNFGFFQDNGGATQTQALLEGSPAIDAGNPGGCSTDNLVVILTTDQRGATRPVNGDGALRCDIGAYEYLAKIPQTIGFDALANKIFGDLSFTVTAAASSGLAVTFTAAGQCSVSGNMVTLTGAGTCTVTAHQAGNSNYNAAPDVPRSFTISASGFRLYLPMIVR